MGSDESDKKPLSVFVFGEAGEGKNSMDFKIWIIKTGNLYLIQRNKGIVKNEEVEGYEFTMKKDIAFPFFSLDIAQGLALKIGAEVEVVYDTVDEAVKKRSLNDDYCNSKEIWENSAVDEALKLLRNSNVE